MLLTRSPLSPGPKPWFSLDLHVLSAPPAFVLSQDQTLREGGSRHSAVQPAEDGGLRFELVLKVSPSPEVLHQENGVATTEAGDGSCSSRRPKPARGLDVNARC